MNQVKSLRNRLWPAYASASRELCRRDAFALLLPVFHCGVFVWGAHGVQTPPFGALGGVQGQRGRGLSCQAADGVASSGSCSVLQWVWQAVEPSKSSATGGIVDAGLVAAAVSSVLGSARSEIDEQVQAMDPRRRRSNLLETGGRSVGAGDHARRMPSARGISTSASPRIAPLAAALRRPS